jgi:hypothetical protein
LSDKERERMIKEHPEIKGIENISFIVGREEVNCSKNVFRATSTTGHDSTGRVLWSYKGKGDAGFLDILPGSPLTDLAKIICEKGEGSK